MTTTERYGSEVYGSGAFGGELFAGIHLALAVPVSTNEVKVTLSAAPLHSLPTRGGDALNPTTWLVQRLDTMAYLNVLSVKEYDPLNYGVVTLEAFGPVFVSHQLATTALKSILNEPVSYPQTVAFLGLLSATQTNNTKKVAAKKASATDIANPPSPKASPDTIGGTLVLGTDGDYQTVSGAELVRKLIVRRLVSRPGDFYHLSDYGLGLRDKEPIPAGDLVKLKAAVERQVRLEPEVEDVSASITLNSSNMLTVVVRARLRMTGESITASIPIAQTGVAL